MRISRVNSVAFAVLFLSNCLFANEQPNNLEKDRSEQFANISINYAVAEVRNSEDLSNLMSRSSPLDLLSYESRQRFIDSLKFGENGVSSFYYEDLEKELSPVEIYKLLSLFGLQHFTVNMKKAKSRSAEDALIMLHKKRGASINLMPIKDHMNFECSKRATCSPSGGSICTSNC